jgi:hypothetical protein
LVEMATDVAAPTGGVGAAVAVRMVSSLADDPVQPLLLASALGLSG